MVRNKVKVHRSEAMCLVFDQPNLPFEGGVLTPAVACGEALARLGDDCMTMLMLDDSLEAMPVGQMKL